MESESPRVPVTVTLILTKRGRRGNRVHFWRRDVMKPAGWTAADFNPFLIVADTGYKKHRFYLSLDSVNPVTSEATVSHAIAYSQSELLDEALTELGWKHLGMTKEADRG